MLVKADVKKIKEDLNECKFYRSCESFVYEKIQSILALNNRKEKINSEISKRVQDQLDIIESEFPSFQNLTKIYQLKCLAINELIKFINDNGCLPKKGEIVIDRFWDIHTIWDCCIIYSLIKYSEHYETVKKFLNTVRDNNISINAERYIVSALNTYEKRNNLSYTDSEEIIPRRTISTRRRMKEAIAIIEYDESSTDTDEPLIARRSPQIAAAAQSSNNNESSNDKDIITISDSDDEIITIDDTAGSSSNAGQHKRKRKQDESMYHENYDSDKLKKFIKLLNDINEL